MKKIAITIVLLALLQSCARQFSPNHAASHRMKCGRGVIR